MDEDRWEEREATEEEMTRIVHAKKDDACCLTCRYWVLVDTPKKRFIQGQQAAQWVYFDGWCQRFPPQIYRTEDDGDDWNEGMWPATESHHWCGEYSAVSCSVQELCHPFSKERRRCHT